jgi:hypothetical protein
VWTFARIFNPLPEDSAANLRQNRRNTLCISREPLIQSARADCEEISRQSEAQKRRNTLCISSFCNDVMARNFRKTPTTIDSVVPMVLQRSYGDNFPQDPADAVARCCL